jgi:hypothetical protein
VQRSTAYGLVYRADGPVRQGVPAPRQEAQVRDQGAPEEPQPQVRSDLHLQESALCVSIFQLIGIVSWD